MRIFKFLPILVLAGFLAACDSSKDEEVTKPPESAEQLYSEAYQQFSKGAYKDSVKSFEEVERQHPSSPWATRAQVMSGYASYQAEDYQTAISTLERFSKLYPNNPSTPYAYYLIALCYYEQINDVGRDQKVTEQALQALREVVRRFPDSEYARDAKVKLDLTVDHLAGKEMEIGRYYLRHDDLLAAINRFRFVIENYQTTSHVPEALHRMVEAYLKLGVKDEAKHYAAVLGANFPGSIWYRDSYRLMGQAGPVKYADESKMPQPPTEEPTAAEHKSFPPPEDTNPPAAESASWWSDWISSSKTEEKPSSQPVELKPIEVKMDSREEEPAEPAEVKNIESREVPPPAPAAAPADNSPSWWDRMMAPSEEAKPAETPAKPVEVNTDERKSFPPPADTNAPKSEPSWWDNLIP